MRKPGKGWRLEKEEKCICMVLAYEIIKINI